jgi:mRNA interferase MazF
VKKGTIVLTRFPFTDLSGSKRRPAVIISGPAKTGSDVIVAFISSKVVDTPKATEFLLDPNHPDFAETGLKRPSLFKLDKLATVDRSLLVGEIGYLSHDLVQEINRRLWLALDP